jgi:hypothetical protein
MLMIEPHFSPCKQQKRLSLATVALRVAILPALRLTIPQARIGRAAVSRNRDRREVFGLWNLWAEDEEQSNEGKRVAHGRVRPSREVLIPAFQ